MKTNLLSGDERFARTFSYPAEQFEQGLPIEVATKIIHPDDLDRVNSLIERTVKQGDPYRAEYRIKRPDGSYLWILASGRRDVDADGVPYRFPGVLIDFHERKIAEESLKQLTQHLEQRVADAVEARSAAEEQLRQAQKLEAIGALTGGVAHDFNNVLQVISGNLQLLALKAPDNDFVQGRVSAADNAIQRGAKLASQLLAFARRQPLSPAVLNPRSLFDELGDLLQRALGETITVEMTVPEKPWLTLVDRNQLESALLNLTINARDAMRGEGVIVIASENIVLGQQYCVGKDIAPGDYVRLSVSDTGAGMSPEVLAHAFEPFFTTKPEGHGTGLGLSMVFGFVKQSGGHTDIASALGKGTVVSMYFPRSDAAESIKTARIESTLPAGGRETILVVEDDANVRDTVVELLRTLGYTVLAAANGDAALHALKSGAAVDLVFTDVVMPGEIKSADLAAWVGAQSPSIPVLFTSGHTRDILSRDGILGPDVFLLSKPYRPDALTAMIRKVLSAKHP
jgi:PAS domain S-box-containing protein